MNGHTKPLLVMIHGVSSSGPWFDDVRAVLKPFVVCQGVRYRAYHCFGAFKVFFWPWALLLSMILMAFGMAAPVKLAVVGDLRKWLPGVLIVAGLVEAYRTRGATRGLPWLIAAGWSLTCLAGWWNPATLLFIFFWFVTGWIVWCEIDWPQPGQSRLVAISLTVGVALIGYFFSRWGRFGSDLPIWVAALAQIVILEWRECRDGDQISNMWKFGLLAVAAGLGFAWLPVEQTPGLGLLFASVLLIVGAWEPYLRVKRTLESVHRLVAKSRQGYDGKVHLIGHSLGTFLSGRYFESYPSRWDRLVFVGGVISEKYDWIMWLNDNDELSRIQDVRNEHGGFDVVVRAIGFAGKWATAQGLGTAGWRGLRPEAPPEVHDVANPYHACPNCPPRTRLHNFHFPDYMHSTYFFVPTHMQEYWLPHFLGHVPLEFWHFRKLCVTGMELLRKKRLGEFKPEVADKMRSVLWHWDRSSGQTLDEIVRGNLGVLLPELDNQFPQRNPLPSVEILDSVPRMLCQLVTRALAAQNSGEGPDELIEMLNPPDAIAKVAETALLDMRLKLGLD